MLYVPMVQAGSVGNYQKSKLSKLYPQPKCQSHYCSHPVSKVGVQNHGKLSVILGNHGIQNVSRVWHST